MTANDYWVVWQWETGQIWNIQSPTAENAKRESDLAGQGHEAMLMSQAVLLGRSFAHGRMRGHREAREQLESLSSLHR